MVGVEVYDVLGRLVNRLTPQMLSADANTQLTLDAAGLASGMYAYRITRGHEVRMGILLVAR